MTFCEIFNRAEVVEGPNDLEIFESLFTHKQVEFIVHTAKKETKTFRKIRGFITEVDLRQSRDLWEINLENLYFQHYIAYSPFSQEGVFKEVKIIDFYSPGNTRKRISPETVREKLCEVFQKMINRTVDSGKIFVAIEHKKGEDFKVFLKTNKGEMEETTF